MRFFDNITAKERVVIDDRGKKFIIYVVRGLPDMNAWQRKTISDVISSSVHLNVNLDMMMHVCTLKELSLVFILIARIFTISITLANIVGH